jgi:hypothetical protein
MARTTLTTLTTLTAQQPLKTQRSVKMKKSLQTSVAPNNPRARRDSVASDRRHARADMAGSAGRNRAHIGQASFRRSSPASTPAAARGRASSGINKSAFVRSLPSSLSAAEVIEKGKAKGIKLSAAQVYTIRANARRKGPDTDTARLLSSARGVRDGGGAKARGRASGKEAEFVAAALDLGLARAEALIRALRARASSGWS